MKDHQFGSIYYFRIGLGACLALILVIGVVAQPGVPQIQQFSMGEWSEITALGQIYEFDLDAGTSIDITIGLREALNFDVHLYGPNALDLSTIPLKEVTASRDDIYALRLSKAFNRSELFSVAAATRGKYRLRLAPTAPVRSKFSVFVSKPRPTVANDHKLMEAALLMYRMTAFFRNAMPGAEAAELARKRVSIYREIADDYSLAIALELQSRLAATAGESKDALAAAIESRSLLLKTGNGTEAINVSPCYLYQRIGEMQAWIFCERDNVALSRKIGSREKEAAALRGLGLTYHLIADEERARENFQQALNIWRSLSTDSKPYAFEQIQLLTDLGKMKRGITALNQPVELYPERTEADLREAISYFRQAMELESARPSGFKPYLLWQIGAATRDLGDLDGGLRSLEEATAAYNKSTGSIAMISVDIADIYAKRGEKRRAHELLTRALPVLKNQNASHIMIADLFVEIDAAAAAIEIYSRGLESSRKILDLPWMARFHSRLAYAERSIGNFNNARTHIVAAIELSESLRNRIIDDDVRSTYFAATKKFYDFYMELLMQAHKAQPEKQYDRIALEVSEKARSRNLVDLLRSSGVDIHQGVDQDLLAMEKLWRARLTERATRQNRLMMVKHSPDEAIKMQLEVIEASESMAKTEAEIRRRSPGYASITQPTSLSVGQIQDLLDAGTLMLEYSLGENKSFLWVISRDSMESYELPSRGVIDNQVRAVHRAITARNSRPEAETVRLRTVRLQKAEGDLRFTSAVLSETLLAPAARHLKNRRLVVMPDGALNYISFAALPMPSQLAADGDTQPALIESHEIVTLPSASTLVRLRDDRVNRAAAPKMLAVFADPVFSERDSRTTGRLGDRPAIKTRQKTVALRDLEIAGEGAGLLTSNGFPRLPFSRREADDIASMLPKNVFLKQTDFRASKDAVFSSSLDQYRMVHFATHGLLDSRHPALSGMVLSLVDRSGGEVDGFLRLQDVYNLKLNADLVVLSACNTALGKEVRGEGIVGLTRGFMYAGTQRVVASLWKVDDAATAALMAIFYRKMLAEKMRPAAALRAAQMEMMKQPRWRSPYYWAPFVLQGEWK